jgi:opacity protein-like surface antigen
MKKMFCICMFLMYLAVSCAKQAWGGISDDVHVSAETETCSGLFINLSLSGGVMKTRLSLLALVILVIAVVAVQPASAQQYVQKWDAYGGYTYLNTPTNSMSQYGYNLSFGRNINNWLALGADFSNFRGSGAQGATGTELAAKLPAAALAGLPPSLIPALPLIGVSVPVNLNTSTFAAGTQFQIRKTKWVTPFARPFLGLFHAKAQGDPLKITATTLPPGVTAATLTAVLASIPQATLNQALTQDATVMGYGVGGGVDLNLSKPIGVRVALDYIRTPLFGARQNNIRFGFGLIYRFGGEIKHK